MAVATGAASTRSAVVVPVVAAISVATGAPLGKALADAAPLVVFLTAALSLAAAAQAAGLAARAADVLALRAGGHAVLLYTLVCLACALLTAMVSLDGAIVLIVPLLLELHRRHHAPLAPLLLGSVAVANAASIAVPQGNPTNLVLIERLGISPLDFAAQMLPAGLAAALACAFAVALLERRALAEPLAVAPRGERRVGNTAERRMLLALVLAGLAAWVSPLLEIPMWWTFSAVAAVGLALHPRPRPRPVVPLRLATQLTGLLVLVGAIGLQPSAPAHTTWTVLGVAGAVALAAALVNNLPVSVSVGSLLGAGPTAYAAAVGLGVGALATPQGSVATLIAADLAGPDAPRLQRRRLAGLAAAGLLAACAVLLLT